MSKFSEFLRKGTGEWPRLFADPNLQNKVVIYLTEDFTDFESERQEESGDHFVPVKQFFNSEFPRIQGWYQNSIIWQRVKKIFLKDFEEFLNE